MESQFPPWMDRTVQLLGEEKCRKLNDAHVLIAGLGGVGAIAAEMLVRAGIGTITIVDSDVIQDSNINRQIPALQETVGRFKVDIVAERMRDINPDIQINIHKIFIKEDTLDGLLSEPYNFIVDAIDTLTPKILFIEKAYKSGYPLASSMGSGGKTDPTKIEIADFKKSYNCRLAFFLRKKLRKIDVHGGFKVVFSTELPDKDCIIIGNDEPNKKSVLGTISYIPNIFGCMLASIVVEGLTS